MAASTLAPCVNTATRTVLPVPFGNTTEPRTTWSDLRGSTPKFTETSIDSSNLAVAAFLTKLNASLISYTLLRSKPSRKALIRLDTFAIYTPSVSIPIERAEPAIIRTAASKSAAVKSGSLALAISSN